MYSNFTNSTAIFVQSDNFAPKILVLKPLQSPFVLSVDRANDLLRIDRPRSTIAPYLVSSTYFWRNFNSFGLLEPMSKQLTNKTDELVAFPQH